MGSGPQSTYWRMFGISHDAKIKRSSIWMDFMRRVEVDAESG